MTKTITIRISEGGIVRVFEVPVNPGTTSVGILRHWRLNEHFLQDAVSNLIYPRMLDLFPLVRDGQVLEVVHESMVET